MCEIDKLLGPQRRQMFSTKARHTKIPTVIGPHGNEIIIKNYKLHKESCYHEKQLGKTFEIPFKNVWIFKNAINILRVEKSLFCFLQKKFEKQKEFLEIKSFKLKAQYMG